MIINICYKKYSEINIAECYAQPVNYFEFGSQGKKIDLDEVPEIGKDVTGIIFGGGGIYSGEPNNAWLTIKNILSRTPPGVPAAIWGMGINDHDRIDRNYHKILAELESRPKTLVGLRDSFYRNYVPCASCMRPEFDQEFEIENPVVNYSHHLYKLDLPFPTMSNSTEGDPEDCFKKVIRFLGTAGVVITNTYHGAYWATLLKKRVLVVAPFSNKFLGLKYQPIMIQRRELVAEVLTLTKSYPEALADSRRANLAFYDQVASLFRQDGNAVT